MAESKYIEKVSDQDFTAKIAQGVALVDFFAEWCGPCKTLTPILEGVAKEMSNTMRVFKLDIDVSQSTTANFNVTSVPTLILFKNGQEIQRFVGLKDAETLKNKINSAIQ